MDRREFLKNTGVAAAVVVTTASIATAQEAADVKGVWVGEGYRVQFIGNGPYQVEADVPWSPGGYRGTATWGGDGLVVNLVRRSNGQPAIHPQVFSLEGEFLKTFIKRTGEWVQLARIG